jgi:hypothetical protein
MNGPTPKLSKTIMRGLQLLCECAENGVPARCAERGQPAASEYLTRGEYKRYIVPLINGPRPQFGSKGVRRGVDVLFQCAQFGIAASAEWRTRTETRYVVSALKYINGLAETSAEPVIPRKVRLAETSAEPVIPRKVRCEKCARRRQQTPELPPFRKVHRVVRVRTGGWRLHLVCGHTAFWAS